MRYCSLAVTSFGCVRRAALQLGPGLNVLYGPNELGKSTLARALRAVLLVQHTSTAGAEHTSWYSAEPPGVRLVFETADRTTWRVEKVFGPRPTALLERSRDGRTYVVQARGREVDDVLRGLLGWGVAAPATGSAPRGLPTSLLATVLLGEQAGVADALAQTLATDTSDTGRVALTRALAALAQDPEFKKLLDRAQERTNEGYTPTGRLRTGRGSPLHAATVELGRAREDLASAERRVEDVAQARRALERAQTDAQRATVARAQAERALETLRTAVAGATARAEAERVLGEATVDLTRRQAEVEHLARKVEQLTLAHADVDAALAALVQADAALAAATVALAAAEEDVRRAEGADEELAARLREAELDRRVLELDAALAARAAERRSYAEGRDAAVALREATARCAAATAERAAAGRASEAAVAAREAAAAQVAVLEHAAGLAAREATRDALTALDAERARAESERVSAQAARAAAAALVAAREPLLPTADEIARMRAAYRELELAEAACAGLTVNVERWKAVEVAVEVDGGPASSTPSAAFQIDAAHSVRLQLGDVARIAIAAGDVETRSRARALRARWEAEGAPVLARHGGDVDVGCASDEARVEALARRVAVAAEREREIARQTALALASDERAARLAGLDASRARLLAELAAHDRVLDGRGEDLARRALAEHGAAGLTAVLDRARSQHTAAGRAADEAAARQRQLAAEGGVLAERLEVAQRRAAEVGPPPADGWDEAVRQVDQERAASERDRAAAARARAELGSERTGRLARAADALHGARARCEAANAVRAGAAERLEQARVLASRLEGEVEARRAAVAALDVPGARAREEAARAARDATAVPSVLATASDVADAERGLERARQAERLAIDELRRCEGAYDTMGGQVAEEEADHAREAFERAQVAAHEVEVDFAAWRMLTEALRSAENTEGRHLGEALSVPVGERFAALTAGRYDRPRLSAELTVQGIEAGGVLRELARLSEGARDQLATLLRLTVAAQLGSALVLDDHLVQADPDRSRWFASELRAHATRHQVIVLTCDPLRYVEAQELPISGAAEATLAGGLVRVVDLGRVIERDGPRG